jgi:cobalamin biosynthetic protein CobC
LWEERSLPEHGGNLLEATHRFGEPEAGWLDLSTGVNPVGYPAPAMSAAAWHHLPEGGDGLREAAAAYYGTGELLAVPGSQVAIQALPRLRRPCTVAVLWPTYAEHAHRWERAGHTVERVTADNLEAAVDRVDVLVVANPNNPDGHRFPPEQLRHWRRRLARRGGWLVVDEAFADAIPGLSLADEAHEPGLVVLRSVGKFFGLAGARVGFLAAPEAVRNALAEEIGPWPVSGPGREVTRAALADTAWQAEARKRLEKDAEALRRILARAGMEAAGGTPLFQWVPVRGAEALRDRLAGQGVWVRRFEEPLGLRFGLPAAEMDWKRLEAALGRQKGV